MAVCVADVVHDRIVIDSSLAELDDVVESQRLSPIHPIDGARAGSFHYLSILHIEGCPNEGPRDDS